MHHRLGQIDSTSDAMHRQRWKNGSGASTTRTYRLVHHYKMKLKLVDRKERTRRVKVMHYHEERDG